MRLYVESNFCLEIAFEQEESQAAEDLLVLAEAGKLELMFPAFAIAEPFSTVDRYRSERRKFIEGLNSQLHTLGRSAPTQAVAQGAQPLVATLTNISQTQAKRLADVVERMLTSGTAIPLTVARFQSARQLQVQFDLSPQDGIIAACVLDDLGPLAAAADSHLFLSRNSNDFDVMRPDFQRLGCEYLSNFEHGLKWAKARI